MCELQQTEDNNLRIKQRYLILLPPLPLPPLLLPLPPPLLLPPLLHYVLLLAILDIFHLLLHIFRTYLIIISMVHLLIYFLILFANTEIVSLLN